MRRFAITGHGRSGTKFLAREMGRSREWTVAHEPNTDTNLLDLKKRFAEQEGNYGEVNSYLLYAIHELPVQRRGVLLRDPLDIAVSMANMGHPPTQAMADHIAASMALIDVAIETGRATPISFHAITRSPEALQSVLWEFGIQDVPTDALSTATENASQRTKVDNFSDFDRGTRTILEHPVRWFREKYWSLLGLE